MNNRNVRRVDIKAKRYAMALAAYESFESVPGVSIHRPNDRGIINVVVGIDGLFIGRVHPKGEMWVAQPRYLVKPTRHHDLTGAVRRVHQVHEGERV